MNADGSDAASDNAIMSKKNSETEEEQPEKQPLVPVGMMPQYLAEAFGQVYEEDGMVVLGKGLGCLLLIASFVRFYADTKEGHVACMEENGGDATTPTPTTRKPSKPPLVLVFGLKETERKALITILQSWGTPPELLPTMITNESGHSSDRATLYQQGGVFCITSRILIVDLLTNVARANDINGILVAHADQVTEQSTEAFILRIFQSQKQASATTTATTQRGAGAGFVKAFTDAPDRLLSGFAKVDKVLKALHVRRLYLYPRFHESIRDELEEHPPTVTELHQALSSTQQEMQSAIAAAVQACIRELKSSTKVLEWTDSELSVENCVTAHFDKAISRQLEHEWHKLRPQTKQLVQDLRTLRTLFQSLIHYDCVSFLKLINSIKTMSAASRNPSMWLLTPAADLLFRKAKERVYRLVQPRPTAKTPNPMVQLEAVLEENPKWKLLGKVLAEVRQDYEEKQKKRHQSEEKEDEGPTNVLVMVKDEKTLEAVKNYLVDGKKRTLTLRWLRFLEQYNDRSRSISGNSTAGAASMSEESRLLLEEESRCRRVLFGQDAKRKQAQRKRSKQGGLPDYVKKRRRIATEKGRGELTHQTDDLEREAVLDDALEEAEHEMQATSYVADELGRSKQADEEQDEAIFQPSNPEELRVILKSFSSAEGDEALLLLQDLQPRYVLFYDTEVSFIRAVEIYAALSTSGAQDPVQVYFLIFEASAEEKNFMKSLEREQNSFERLIQHKKTMPPPAMQMHASQEMQLAANSITGGASYMDGSLPLAFDSRTGKGKSNTSKERRDIAVDVREFRSALPSILHQGGMRLAPVTLTVGDFVLSSVHCVERKSISDLFGSFASGRLYTQAEAMCKYYKAPCLLIEFDPEKSFCLQNANELGVDIRNDSICSKMALLTMHFPRLRILWSRSPHETLRIFSDLKANHDEVDVDKAVEIGRSESVEALLQGPPPAGKSSGEADKDGEDEDEEDEINEAARDMLLRLPGVNIHVARRIMEEVDSLAELAEMSRDELRRVAGPVAGQKLFTFFHQKMGSV